MRKKYHISELLGGDDRTFVTNLYRALLKRQPEPKGFENHIAHLRRRRVKLHRMEGSRPRQQTLRDIAYSEEGKRIAIYIEGLSEEGGTTAKQVESNVLEILEASLEYEEALRGAPDSRTPHRDYRAALEAWRRWFSLRPTWAVAGELQHLGLSLAAEIARLGLPQREPLILFEVSDLFWDMGDNRTVSGIQRVQLGLIAQLLKAHESGEASNCRLVLWQGDNLWQLQDRSLEHILEIYKKPKEDDLLHRREMISVASGEAMLVCPTLGDIFFSTGIIYLRPDVAR